MADLAEESSTMRRVLEPMFVHFDHGRHWVSPHGSAVMVLSDMIYFVESSGDLLIYCFLNLGVIIPSVLMCLHWTTFPLSLSS